MKIAYVVNYYKPAWGFGGGVSSAVAMCESLAALGADVHVLTTDVDVNGYLPVPVDTPITDGDVTITYFTAPRIARGRLFLAPALVRGAARAIAGCDVVILDLLLTQPLGPLAAACRRAGVPYVVPLHGQLLPWALARRTRATQVYLAALGRSALNGAAALWCTDATETQNLGALGITAAAMIVPHAFRPAAPGATRDWRADMRARGALLLMLGRLHRKKRPDIAVDVAARLRRDGRDCTLVFAGPDEDGLQDGLTAQAFEAGCAADVRFAGPLVPGDAQSLLSVSNILLMPSEAGSENFGMAALEAAAAGIPVIASEGVPIARMLAEQGGAFFLPCCPDAFHRTAARLLSEDGLAASVGTAAQRIVSDRFAAPRVARQLLDALQDLRTQAFSHRSCSS
jgi:glycosyltransferase involved in cell wall biosynthesis